MSTDTMSRKAIAAGARLPGGRVYDAAETLTWLAGLNLLIIGFTLLGGIVVGLAPALVAAASVSRARVRGDAQPLLRTFAGAWRRELLRANIAFIPFAAIGLLLGANLWALAPGGGPVVAALWAGLVVVGLSSTFALTLYVHYDLPPRRYAATAVRYLLHDLPAAALVAVVTVLAVLATLFLPGLAPVLTIAAWIHTVTAICLSCYERNDRLLEAGGASPE